MKDSIGKIRRRGRSGSVMMEFAIGVGVLVAAFAGVFQFGFSFLQYNKLQNAVIRGARYASMLAYDSDSTTPSAQFETAVQNIVVYGTPSPAVGAPAAVAGLTTGNVDLVVTPYPGGTSAQFAPYVMTVSIVGDTSQNQLGFPIDSIFGTIELKGKPMAAYAYQGLFEPVTP